MVRLLLVLTALAAVPALADVVPASSGAGTTTGAAAASDGRASTTGAAPAASDERASTTGAAPASRGGGSTATAAVPASRGGASATVAAAADDGPAPADDSAAVDEGDAPGDDAAGAPAPIETAHPATTAPPPPDVNEIPPPSLGLGELVGSLVKMLLMLGVVVALAYLTLSKGLGKLVERQNVGKRVKVVERVALDAKRSLFLVELDGKQMLLSAGEGGVVFLRDVDQAAPKPAPFADTLKRTTDRDNDKAPA